MKEHTFVYDEISGIYKLCLVFMSVVLVLYSHALWAWQEAETNIFYHNGVSLWSSFSAKIWTSSVTQHNLVTPIKKSVSFKKAHSAESSTGQLPTQQTGC